MPTIPVPINSSEAGSGVAETEAGGPVNRLRGGCPPGVGGNAADEPGSAAGGVPTEPVVPPGLKPDGLLGFPDAVGPPGTDGGPDGE